MTKLFFGILVFLLALGTGLFATLSGSRLYAAWKEDRRFDLITTIDLFRKAAGPRFQVMSRGCGMGYIENYTTNDGINVSEGNIGCSDVPGEKNRFMDAQRKPNRVLWRTTERAVLEINEDGKRYFEIYEISDSACTHYVTAPTLDLALEFEAFLETRTR